MRRIDASQDPEPTIGAELLLDELEDAPTAIGLQDPSGSIHSVERLQPLGLLFTTSIGSSGVGVSKTSSVFLASLTGSFTSSAFISVEAIGAVSNDLTFSKSTKGAIAVTIPIPISR